MANLNYKILLQEEPEGGYTVIVPSLPGCVTYGSTISEAKEMAKEAIEGYISVLKDEKQPIPDDSATLEYTLTIAS